MWSRQRNDAQMQSLFSDGFPSFITADREVPKHIGRKGTLFGVDAPWALEPHNRALARRGQGLELCVEHVVIRAGTVRQHDRVPRPSTVPTSQHTSRSLKLTSQIYHLLYISNRLRPSLGSLDQPTVMRQRTHR